MYFSGQRFLACLAMYALLGICIDARGATINAASISQAAVQNAVNSARTGDTVAVPAGSANWAAPVTVSQPIIIKGAGSGSSVITNTTHATSGLETPCFVVSLHVDQRFEISGFHLAGIYIGNACSNGITLVSGSVLATQIVIHDIVFDGFSFGVQNGNNGNAIGFGVVYNCTFLNCRITCRNSGFYKAANLRGSNVPSPAWGTAHYMVYEDNSIQFTKWTGGFQGANYMGDTEYPMNYMVRHCTFNINRHGSIEVDGYDMHGSGSAQIPSSAATNGFGFVIHDNVFNYTGGSVGAKLADIRGGVGALIYNNTIHGQNGNYITLRADPPGSVAPTQVWTWNNVEDDGPIAGVGSNGPPPGYAEIAYPHPLRGGNPRSLLRRR